MAIDNAQLYEERQEAVRLRDEFMVVASHELNTPAAALMLSLRGLHMSIRRKPIEERVVDEVADIAERQGVRLTRLIGELLDATSFECGGVALDPRMVDLAALVKGGVARAAGDLERAGCAVSVEAPESIAGLWDRERIEQVLASLLSNAAKFGAGKPIEIHVEGGRDRARFSVVDHGIGIDPAQQARIFDRFARGVSAEHYGGLGLGLYICRHIVEAHCGSIVVESRPGHGATFTVELPCAGPPTRGERGAQDATTPPAARA
jgi:signal transduction histidine kinase